MSETVPLCPTLGVQFVCFIVSDVLGQGLDVVFEAFSVKCWDFGVIQW